MRSVRKKKNEGFTLVELIVVVAILGFLLSIAIPRYLTARTTAAQAATKANLHQLASSMELYMTEHPEVGDKYPLQASGGGGSNDDAVEWLSAYIPKAPKSPGGDSYKYKAFNNGQSYAIWDPGLYGGKCFAAGPGGTIGEGTGDTACQDAVEAATGISDPNIGSPGDLSW